MISVIARNLQFSGKNVLQLVNLLGLLFTRKVHTYPDILHQIRLSGSFFFFTFS